ncbi:RDD family protein [Salicibibacter cibi]|uniref:RDD family protein n=2 Tax=Salicibibacter cibi TaxID=2743001 RepID=A0A7T6ZEG7_9BACI|nr:RDD family protein [Salicibibacter cibi]
MQNKTSHSVEVSMYAGFWMRVWAYLVDLLIVFSLNALFIRPIFMFLDASPTLFFGITVVGLLTSVVAYVYFGIMTKLVGQTLGKMIFGLRVQREDGGPLTWGDVFFREVAGRMIHRVLGFTNLMYILVGLHPQKAGVHDLLADTRVVLDRRKNKNDHDDE